MYQTGEAEYTVRKPLLEKDEAPQTRLGACVCSCMCVCRCLSVPSLYSNKCVDSVIISLCVAVCESHTTIKYFLYLLTCSLLDSNIPACFTGILST